MLPQGKMSWFFVLKSLYGGISAFSKVKKSFSIHNNQTKSQMLKKKKIFWWLDFLK